MQRRDFLKLAGFFTLAIHLPNSLVGCGATSAVAAKGQMAFLHGVASGDPRESSVVLWTRISPLEDTTGYVDIKIQVATDENFSTIIADSDVRIDESSDYTLRFLISDLSSDTIYYYRFIANNQVTSMTGRTWTAPQRDSDVAINFSSTNCQNREHAFYSAYTLMLKEDLLKPRDEQIRFILHLGDFVYETRNDALQYPTDEAGNRLASLIDAQGQTRTVRAFPDGNVLSDGSHYAVSLDDYRHLYKTYLLDPELQAARARWPFICIWDDHEFTDDYWQSEANYDDIGIDSSINEPSQQRKIAANQAWYEYIPVDYSADLTDDIPHHAQSFQAAQISNTLNSEFDDNGLANNADNLAAIGSLTIYRSLRFGNNLQLVLTDCRSYRSDHALPEDISGNFQGFVHSRMALPLALINTLDAGREANDKNPPDLLDLPLPLLNPRRTSPPGSMLGKQQKQWWKEVLTQSDTRWNIWGNSVPLMRLGINLSALPINISDIILSSDTWDGYNTERRELMTFLHENNISNVVSIAGDVHAYYAGEVLNNYDSGENNITHSIPEFVCGAISSISQFDALDQLSLRENPDNTEVLLRQLIIFEDKATGERVCNFNSTMLRGAETAITSAQVADVNAVVENTVASLNSHLQFADTNAHGYSLFHIDSDELKTEFVVVNTVRIDPISQIPQSLRRTGFTVTAQENAEQTNLQGPFISGTPPYPFGK